MPRFYPDVDSVDVEVDEFYDACSESEQKKLAEYVIEDGLASPLEDEVDQIRSMGIQHDNYLESLKKLSGLYFSLSLEDIEKIIELSRKYS